MSNRIARKNALPLVEVFKQMLAESGASATHNTNLIFSAWDTVSGVGAYTIKRFFRDGKLYITLSSSVICSQLAMQKDVLVAKINSSLAGNELYIGQAVDGPVKQLILK
jgi:predicted nucleic acid-binding Zn ribbon protein